MSSSLVRRAPARAAGLVLACALPLAACSDAPTGPVPAPTGRVAPTGPVQRIAVPTYDGSGQAVHPDVVVFDHPWHGATHWMAVTPYPNGNAAHENPSILAGDDGVQWAVPAGATNPVIPAPRFGYNSDPDLVHDAAGDRLVLLWREVSDGHNVILSSDSRDGRAWSAPATILRVPNHQALSPAVVLRDGGAQLWYVDAGAPGCRATSSTVRLRTAASLAALRPASPAHGWSAPQATSLSIPGRVVWHLDVAHVAERGEYWAVVHAYAPSQGCGGGDLYVAWSRDGVSWESSPEPVLRAGGAGWSGASLYRSSIVWDAEAGVLRTWLSGRSSRGEWSLGYVELAFTDLADVPRTRPVGRTIARGRATGAPARPAGRSGVVATGGVLRRHPTLDAS